MKEIVVTVLCVQFLCVVTVALFYAGPHKCLLMFCAAVQDEQL